MLNILPADAKAKILASTGQVPANKVAFALLPVFERLSALLVHWVCCVLLVCAVRVRQWRWFWLSSGYKTFIDGFAAYAVMRWHVMASTTRRAEFKAIIFIFAVVSLPALRMLKVRFAALEAARESPEFSITETKRAAFTGNLP